MSEDTADDEYKYVFTNKDPIFLEEEGREVIETFDFGEGNGFAAKVKIDGLSISVLEVDERVDGVEDDIELELLTNLDQISKSWDDLVTIDDIRKFNSCPATGATGKGITVAIMDSGIDGEHSVFNDTEILERHDFTNSSTGDKHGHGTAVSGQVVRLAPDVDLISTKIFGNSGRTGMDVILRCYQWLLQNTDKYDIVNMSWGSSRKVSQLDNLQNKLVESGVVDVTASGNSGGKPGSPATAKLSFSVGANSTDGGMASFSDASEKNNVPEVTSFGENCRLAQAKDTSMGHELQGPWVKASGTSFAAPQVAGIMAKLMEDMSSGSPMALISNARDMPNTTRDGNGIADYKKALANGPEEPDEPPKEPPSTSAHSWSFAGYDTLFIKGDFVPSGSMRATKVSENDNGDVTIKFEPN